MSRSPVFRALSAARGIAAAASLRLILLTAVVGCTAPHQDTASALAGELRDLPDANAAIAEGRRALSARALEDLTASWGDRVVPTMGGVVVEVWRDRLAARFDDDGLPPEVGSFLTVYDNSGCKADVYVVRVDGRIALGQLAFRGAGAKVELRDRVCAQTP